MLVGVDGVEGVVVSMPTLVGVDGAVVSVSIQVGDVVSLQKLATAVFPYGRERKEHWICKNVACLIDMRILSDMQFYKEWTTAI